MGSPHPNVARPNRTAGRYQVHAKLAAGGMATVHLGRLIGPAGFSKIVAIKRLRKKLAQMPEFVAMFLDEARIASAINHPNVVGALDVVVDGSELLVIMEYVHGETLANLLRLSRHDRELVPLPVAVRVVCDMLEGLHSAHTTCVAGQPLGIVHRDVSPQNIMVGVDGNTRILDFGIARAAHRSSLTSAGVVKGKTAYMSPEQVQGLLVDARTDVFAAGVVLWEALTGQRLFYAPKPRDVVAQLLRSPIRAPSLYNREVTPQLDRVVLKALERDPDERYQSALELAEALRAATPEGSRANVAAWVTRVAAANLASRLDLLHAVEAIGSGRESCKRESPRLPVRSSHPRPTVAFDGSPIVLPVRSFRRSTRAPWVFAAVGLLSALAAGMLVRREASSLGQGRMGTTEPPRLASSQKGSGDDPAGLPFDVVPLREPHPNARILATSSSPNSTPPSGVRDPEMLSASTRQVSTLMDDAPPIVSADSMPLVRPAQPTSRTVVRKSVQTKAAPRTSAVSASTCSPPYRIDASGIRRVKPECL
jgi:serine/threonine-protein kinase